NVYQQTVQPCLVPGQSSRLGILEEAMQSNIRASQEIRPTIEITLLGHCIEAELSHAEAGLCVIPRRARVDSIEKWVFRAPKVGCGERDNLLHELRFTCGQPDLQCLPV